MKFEDILYVYMDGVDGDAGPEYKDTGRITISFASHPYIILLFPLLNIGRL